MLGPVTVMTGGVEKDMDVIRAEPLAPELLAEAGCICGNGLQHRRLILDTAAEHACDEFVARIGRLACGDGWRRRTTPSVTLVPHAVQSQCCSPSPYPQTAAPGDELGRVRCGLAPAWELDGLVHGGGGRGLGSRAAHHTRRAAALLGSGDHDGADPQGGVPLGSAPDRRPDRVPHSSARARSLCSRPHHPEPPSRDVGGPTTTVRHRARAPAGGQHGPEALRGGRVAVEKHGTKTRRSWRKLHLGRDADTGQIIAATLTTHDVDDGSQVGPLLDQVDGQIASFTGDGAYDQDGVYASVAERYPEAAVIVPPRATAVPSATAETAPTQRDRHLELIAEKGRMAWQRASGYTKRARAEATIGRFKRVIGDGLRSRTDERRATEMDVAAHVLNRMLELGRPESVRIA